MEDHKPTIMQWATSWSSHNVDRLVSLFTEDAVYEDVAMSTINRGSGELRRFAEDVLSRLPDVTFELCSSFADGEQASAEWIMRGTRMGQRFEVRGASIFEFAGGTIRRCSDYWDMGGYLKQISQAKTTAGRADVATRRRPST